MSLTLGFALGGTTTSKDFSNTLHALVGDGVTQHGSRFALALKGNFSFSVGTGYALAAGRWLENDEPLTLALSPSGNTADRYDAVAVRVDYEERKAELTVLFDVDPAALIRDDTEYSVILYLLHVKRGATVLYSEDITDTRDDLTLCGRIVPLSEISGNVLTIYKFLTSGIDEEVARLISLSNQVVEKAETAIEDLDAAIQAVRGTSIGDTLVSLSRPAPANEWLLCDGGSVPAEYPALSDVLGGVLPNLPRSDSRFQTWIYGGTPVAGRG